MEKKFSEKHRPTILPVNTHPDLENKSMPLLDNTLKGMKTQLIQIKIKRILSHQKNINICLKNS